MTLIKEYWCNTQPSDEEIKKGIEISSTEHCIVVLQWFFPYSGYYKVKIKEGMSFEECFAQIPESYPI